MDHYSFALTRSLGWWRTTHVATVAPGQNCGYIGRPFCADGPSHHRTFTRINSSFLCDASRTVSDLFPLTGITMVLFSRKTLSASGVVGPLAPSAMICRRTEKRRHLLRLFLRRFPRAGSMVPTLALMLGALWRVSCFSPAAGIRMWQSASRMFPS